MSNYRSNQPYEYSTVNDLNRVNHLPEAKIPQRDAEEEVIELEPGVTFALNHDTYGNHVFVAEISACQPLKLQEGPHTWQYQHRKIAQEILPFLWLGPMAAARDADFIKANNITLLLAIRDARAAAINPRVMDPGRFHAALDIETATFDVYNELDLIQRFRPVIKLINDHLESRTQHRPVTQLSNVAGKALVFCEAGDTRSVAVVALYLIVVFGIATESAIQAIQARRFGIFVAGDMHQMIKNCEDLLRAEKQVAMNDDYTSPNNKHPRMRSQKRHVQTDEVEDEEMQDIRAHEQARRVGLEPFGDIE